ncbi:hypothetical protein J3U35_00380 [Gilliamella sp. B2717]|uniref:hypothetical protein n=1 Tax=Gilliamella sp. B2717 TaxID=2817996 RepID=UPI00226A46F5|nr:hypothetical protein [Gilliamella sp. B2717]MCX8577883.1 hypothetical protein [Gilliamella sp. B2717]
MKLLKKIKHVYLFLILAIFITACNELDTIPPEKSNYIGTWQGEYMVISITKDARVIYNYKKDGVTTTIKGPIQEFMGDDFKVGILGLNSLFKVSTPPYFEDGQWKMVIDDQLVIKTSDLKSL